MHIDRFYACCLSSQNCYCTVFKDLDHEIFPAVYFMFVVTHTNMI